MGDSQLRTEAKQARLITAMLQGQPLEGAAKQAGVGYTTARRWAQEPGFKAALADARRELIGAALDVLSAAGREAASTIREVMADVDVAPAVRLRAAEGILDRLSKWLELDDLARRVAALEEGLTDDTSDAKAQG